MVKDSSLKQNVVEDNHPGNKQTNSTCRDGRENTRINVYSFSSLYEINGLSEFSCTVLVISQEWTKSINIKGIATMQRWGNKNGI